MQIAIVEHNTAILAKEKNFNWPCELAYDEYGEIEHSVQYTGEATFTIDDISNADENGFSGCLAPTQALLQKWLREVHNIHIEVCNYALGYIGHIKDSTTDYETQYPDYEPYFKTYEEALEVGLVEALKLIKEKGAI